jgi:hypothetical protein
MNPIPKLPILDKQLDLRIPKEFQTKPNRIGASYNVKKSTLLRMIVLRDE